MSKMDLAKEVSRLRVWVVVLVMLNERENWSKK